MCPTLEQILSRSLMRGKLPINASSKTTSTTTGNIPSLKVPQAKPASIHRNTSSTNSQSPSSQSTTTTKTTSSHQDNLISAFSGLSTPHYSPDPRAKIPERAVRSGLRSIQDLPSLLHSAVVLDEWRSALQALDEAIDLVVFAAADGGSNTSNNNNSASSSLTTSTTSVPIIRKMISLEHFAAAAKVCASNDSGKAFEKFMEDKMQQISKKKSESATTTTTTSDTATTSNINEQLTDITTEAFCQAGNWQSALEYFEKLGRENRQTIGSLNSCITACGTKSSLWETALKLAAPSIEAREREILDSQILKENLSDIITSTSEGKSSDKIMNDLDEDPSTGFVSSLGSEPLSHFGTVGNNNLQKNQQTKSSNAVVVANAITYASLVSTLESCGKSAEAAKVLKSAPAAEREAVLTSYVALLQVWSDNHGKKSMKRF